MSKLLILMQTRWVQLVLLVLLVNSFAARAELIREENPYLLFEEVSQQAFTRFKKDWPKVEQDPDYLKEIIRQELMPYVDHEYAAFKVLGKYVRNINAQKRQEFVTVFEEYVVSVYAKLFAQYRVTQSVSVEPSREPPESRIAVVRSKIIEPGRPDISLIFKLIKRDGRWRAFDMEAEGISVLNSKRKEISTAYQKIGIDGIIEDLKSKVKKPISLKSMDDK